HGDEDTHAATPALALAHAGGHGSDGHSAVDEHDAHAEPTPTHLTQQGDHDDAHDAHGAHGAHGGNPHESPWIMWLPLVILTVPAIAAGFVNAGGGYFGYKLEELLA